MILDHEYAQRGRMSKAVSHIFNGIAGTYRSVGGVICVLSQSKRPTLITLHSWTFQTPRVGVAVRLLRPLQSFALTV